MNLADFKLEFQERFCKCAEDFPDFTSYKEAYKQVVPAMKKAGFKGQEIRKLLDDCKKELNIKDD